MHEQGPQSIPEWASQERTQDLAWIQENLHIFFPAARQGFQDVGRGAIVSDTTVLVQHQAGESHPFAYLPLNVFEAHKKEGVWDDVVRMVSGYEPEWELVCVLLKNGRESAYCIGLPQLKEEKSDGR